MDHTFFIYLQHMYDFLPLNVLTLTEINIPYINFMTENSQDSIALKSNLIF